MTSSAGCSCLSLEPSAAQFPWRLCADLKVLPCTRALRPLIRFHDVLDSAPPRTSLPRLWTLKGALLRWVESDRDYWSPFSEVSALFFIEKFLICLWFQLFGKMTQEDYLSSVQGQLRPCLYEKGMGGHCWPTMIVQLFPGNGQGSAIETFIEANGLALWKEAQGLELRSSIVESCPHCCGDCPEVPSQLPHVSPPPAVPDWRHHLASPLPHLE